MRPSPRPLLAFAAISALLIPLVLSCGDVRSGPEGASGVVATPTLAWEEHSQRLRDLTKTEEFQAASERYAACLIVAGFARVEGKVPLRDGTLYDPISSGTVTPALADYFSERERCEEESGIAGLRRASGVANPTPDAVRTDAANQEVLAIMACLEQRGWRFGESKKVVGLLVLDPVVGPGEKDAYDADLNACVSQVATR